MHASKSIGFVQEYEAKLEERQKAEKLKFRCKIEEKINAFLKDDKSKTLKFPAMDKFQRFDKLVQLVKISRNENFVTGLLCMMSLKLLVLPPTVLERRM